MKKSIWSWVVTNVFTLIFLFIVDCVIFKLWIKEEAWMSISIINSVCYTFGLFVKPLLIEGKTTKPGNIATIIGLTFLFFILSAFAVGVVLDYALWTKFAWRTTSMFALALLFGRSGPLEKDEEKQEKNEGNKETDTEVKVKILD